MAAAAAPATKDADVEAFVKSLSKSLYPNLNNQESAIRLPPSGSRHALILEHLSFLGLTYEEHRRHPIEKHYVARAHETAKPDQKLSVYFRELKAGEVKSKLGTTPDRPILISDTEEDVNAWIVKQWYFKVARRGWLANASVMRQVMGLVHVKGTKLGQPGSTKEVNTWFRLRDDVVDDTRRKIKAGAVHTESSDLLDLMESKDIPFPACFTCAKPINHTHEVCNMKDEDNIFGCLFPLEEEAKCTEWHFIRCVCTGAAYCNEACRLKDRPMHAKECIYERASKYDRIKMEVEAKRAMRDGPKARKGASKQLLRAMLTSVDPLADEKKL